MKFRLPALLAAVTVAGLALAGPAPTPSAAAAAPPNVVVIMVDDMREDEMRWMPHTRRLLSQFELTDFLSNHPLCCPARAEFLTGQFGQNNGVHHNPGANGGYEKMVDPDNTIATWFDDAGYRTSLVGKFINGWKPELGKPDGWDAFEVLLRGTYQAYNFTVWDDGRTRKFPSVHSNDFVTNSTIARIDKAAENGSPFFHYASYTSPHNYMRQGEWQAGPVPAARHAKLFSDVKPPSKDKPSFDAPPRERIAYTFRQRIRALQSVDEGVRDIVRATVDNGTFDNTVFVFTSDNGYMLGEHGLVGKNVPFEEALQVPLLAAGPGVPRGTSGKGAMMPDLASSLAALADIAPGRPQDGRDDMFRAGGGWSQVLIQADDNNQATPWWWRGVREDARWVYVRYTNRPPQLFDLAADPFQLENLAGQRPEVEKRLKASMPEVANHQRVRTEQQAPLRERTLPNG